MRGLARRTSTIGWQTTYRINRSLVSNHTFNIGARLRKALRFMANGGCPGRDPKGSADKTRGKEEESMVLSQYLTLSRLRRVKRRIKTAKIEEVLSGACLAFAVVGMALSFLSKEIEIPPRWAVQIIILAAFFGFGAAIIDSWSTIVNIWKHQSTKIVVAFVAFGISIISFNSAGELIVGYTHVNPLFFSSSQIVMASIIAPILWVCAIFFVLAFWYIVKFVQFFHSIIISNKIIMRSLPCRILQILFGRAYCSHPKYFQDILIESGTMLGIALMLMIVIPISITIFSSSYTENFLKKTFVTTTFYTNTGVCSNIPDKAKFFFLDHERIIFISDDNQKTLKISTCQ